MFANPDPAATIEDRFLAHSRGDLPAAIPAAGEAPLQCLIIPPQYLRETIRDLLPMLPTKLGGGPSSVLTEGFLWAAFSLDPALSDARLEIQSASDEAARRLASHLPVLTARLLSEIPWADEGVFPAQRSKPEVAGDRIIIKHSVTPVVLQAVTQRVTRHVDQLGKQTQLKQIALAIHNFHSRHGSFPPHAEVRDGQGKPRLSWRVELLPYLDEAELYAQFRLDEPWDSDHNLPLLQKMPPAFASPLAAAGHTQLLAPVGERTIFGGAGPVKFQHVIDGLSNTVMVVVVVPERAVPWTAPEDFVFDPEQPKDGLARDAEGRIPVITADGAYHGLAGDLPASVLRSLFQMNDGKPLRW